MNFLKDLKAKLESAYSFILKYSEQCVLTDVYFCNASCLTATQVIRVIVVSFII